MSLTKAGKSIAVERMLSSGVDKKLIRLLEKGSDVAQHHAIITLKMFYELGGPLAHESLRPGMLTLLPWHARLSLERFVLSDRNIPPSPKPQTFVDLVHKILDTDNNQVFEAMQELIPIIEKASDPRIRDMILQSPLVERLGALLQYGHSEQNRIRSESAFVLMKLACSGGSKTCVERIFSSQVVEKLVALEKTGGGFSDTVVSFLKGMDKCKHLSTAERRVMKQQVVRKVRAAVKGHRFETRIVNSVEAYISEGSRGASSSKQKK
ncbi:hypothetical protein MRB53_011909 [Persea americana]|uniref:Uncharacterized protein n=1 Tax=Persea americana TaxID=3435 RepID=A0ACC2LW37_PERAE|nr:hypothetical protein MRB53_011909 [Persea americana]